MIEKFIIQGGKKLNGVIDVRGAKNVTFPILAATLLSKKEHVISNIPLIEDVFRMLEILDRITQGKGKLEDLDKLEELGEYIIVV